MTFPVGVSKTSTVLFDSSGNELNNTVSTGNSTSTPLGANATFTGTGEDVKDYAQISVLVFADQASADNGLVLEYSTNNTNWDDADFYTLSASSGKFLTLVPEAQYFRLRLTNGPVAQTALRLQVIYRRTRTKPSSHNLRESLSPDNDAELVKAVIVGKRPDGSYVEPLLDEFGRLQVVSTDSAKLYHTANLVSADSPAFVDSGTSGPFTVGGTTFSITINGGLQTYPFSSRGATAGFSQSAANPDTNNGSQNKIKISVDGGPVKEIVIADGFTSGTAIAAALQTQIQANVVNGAGVIVDYNVTAPLRYTFTSGTTGATSSVVITKGGDDLAILLGVGLAYGGTERTGTIANSYRRDEVVTLLSTNLTDVSVSLTVTNLVHIETLTSGASATITVSAGGANTALAFPTSLRTGQTGSGSDELAVNGSVTSVRFNALVPEGFSFVVESLLIRLRSAAPALNKFGNLNQLTNGLLAEYRNGDQPTKTLFNAVTGGDLITQAMDGEITTSVFSDNTGVTRALFQLCNNAYLRLRTSTTGDGIFVTVRDNLSTLTSLKITARGYLE